MDDLITEYRDLLTKVDYWFTSCLSRFPAEIACARGCSSCCRSLFDITLLDAAILRRGFDLLPEDVRSAVAVKAAVRLEGIRSVWPDFSPPFIINGYPEEEWARVMPEDDETPCVLLDAAGCCLVYDHRPLTCRLHGLPLVDLSGEILHDEWCTLNFTARDPLGETGLRDEFAAFIRKETELVGRFNLLSRGIPSAELDTLIPAAVLMSFQTVR